MKKFFIKPKMAIKEIDLADIIATSTGGTTGGGAWGARLDDDFEEFDE